MNLENPGHSSHQSLGQELAEENSQRDPMARIKDMVTENKIMLFMKGSPMMPQCGFSANVIQILNSLGKPYKTFNILKDPAIRQSVKDFSAWPTLPQLYINAQFIGGNDIAEELAHTGELKKLVETL